MNYTKKAEKLQKLLNEEYPTVKCVAVDDCVRITGEVPTYQDVYKIGTEAADKGFYGVINDCKFTGQQPQKIHYVEPEDKNLEGKHVDVLVIGGGVTGCSTLRELTKYNVSCLLVDKEEDVAMEASSHNDGCIHVGLDLKKGQKKLDYLTRAREMLPGLCKDIGVDLRMDGQTVGLTEKWMKVVAPVIKAHAKANDIPGGIEIYNEQQMKELEPNLADGIKWGIHLPGAGCISPYLFTIALGESAVMNGAEISLKTLVTGMDLDGDKIVAVHTNRGTIYPKVVINCAGTFADDIAAMAGDRFFTIHPRKGTDIIMDNAVFSDLSKTGITVFDLESLKNHSKGGGVIPTIDKNSLIGPDAKEIYEKEDFSVDRESINAIMNKHCQTMEKLSPRDIIAYFAGTRAATYEEDFIVQKGKWCRNIVEGAGIQSPGLTCAPAIGHDLAQFAIEELGGATVNEKFNPIRPKPVCTKELSNSEWAALIEKDPRYGRMVCRCEEITEGEIIDAIHGIIPATTVDGVKRRCRPGMGRCQGGFCQPLVTALLAQEMGVDIKEVKRKGNGDILLRETKEVK